MDFVPVYPPSSLMQDCRVPVQVVMNHSATGLVHVLPLAAGLGDNQDLGMNLILIECTQKALPS